MISYTLLVKITLMPVLIAGVTLAVRKWGAGIGGWIGGFPWVAAPISFFMALEQGGQFIADSSPAALMGSVGTILFAYAYTWLAARQWHWLPTLLLSYAAFFVVAFLTLWLHPPLLFAFVINLTVLTAALYFFPKPRNIPALHKQPPYDIPLRMAFATLFVVGVTQAADLLGPSWSGILTPFPIMTSTLAVFTHAQQGSDATARILYGLLLAGYGFTVFLYGVAWLAPSWTLEATYGTLIVATFVINGLTRRLIR